MKYGAEEQAAGRREGHARKPSLRDDCPRGPIHSAWNLQADLYCRLLRHCPLSRSPTTELLDLSLTTTKKRVTDVRSRRKIKNVLRREKKKKKSKTRKKLNETVLNKFNRVAIIVRFVRNEERRTSRNDHGNRATEQLRSWIEIRSTEDIGGQSSRRVRLRTRR